MTNIETNVNEFKNSLDSNHRYASFDYCYNYFRTTRNITEDIEKSCLVLGFYLASWGMFRGSSFILQKSVKHFEPTIRYIATLDKSVWNIDVDNYNDQNIEKIITIYEGVRANLINDNNADLTLITKILLGVFGFVPAFDQYFCKAFRDISGGDCGFRRVNKNSLCVINQFYNSNKKTIDSLASVTFTIDFATGKKTKINYPKAKIIDMYGFTLGEKIKSHKKTVYS